MMEATMPTFHTITPMRYRDASFGERLGLEMVGAVLWPLGNDERMTVLLSALGAQITDTIETEDQIEALIDVLRLQLKLRLHDAKKEDQHRV
jgi:hypothetical protein